MVKAIWSVNRRNLKLLLRQRGLIIQPIIVPIIILFLSAVIFGGGGDDWPVALINHSDSAKAEELVQSIKSSRSNITPYFNIITVDEKDGERLLERGRIHLLIEIPKDFEEIRTVNIQTFNINTDAMKNARLRLEHVLNQYGIEFGEQQIVTELDTYKPNDPWRSAYLGGSSFLLALFMGATLIAANLFVFERENRTRKEIFLTPFESVAAGFGNVITATIASFFTALPTFLIAVAFFRLRPDSAAFLKVLIMMIPVMVACAGVGILVGHWLKFYRVVQPVIVLTSVATTVLGGGFIGVTLLPESAQLFARLWVFSRIFQWFNPVMHQFANEFTTVQIALILVFSMVGLLLVIIAYRREEKLPLEGGQ